MAVVKVEMTITDKEFVSEKGDKIPYYECIARVGNADIRFTPKTEDKSLLKHMLSSAK